jgi:hypothetical protein
VLFLDDSTEPKSIH